VFVGVLEGGQRAEKSQAKTLRRKEKTWRLCGFSEAGVKKKQRATIGLA
jgi:hypothetical protein